MPLCNHPKPRLNAVPRVSTVEEPELLQKRSKPRRADARNMFSADVVHGLTGVRREWRRHGVARAIKCAQISTAKALSMRELRTSNEVNSAAISKLNAKLGYRPLAAWLQLRGPLIA